MAIVAWDTPLTGGGGGGGVGFRPPNAPFPTTDSEETMKRLAMTLAAALAAVAASAWAQTTGTLQVSAGPGFNITQTATINAAREWVINYTADISQDVSYARRVCGGCDVSPPYTMRYGAVSGSSCLGLSQSAISGINGTISLTSWQQTIRARPNTSYCLALFTAESGSYYNNTAFTSVWFRTPPDPSPAPSSSGWGTGCFADPRGYAECNRLRTACNNDPSTTWEQSRNRCIPASN